MSLTDDDVLNLTQQFDQKSSIEKVNKPNLFDTKIQNHFDISEEVSEMDFDILKEQMSKSVVLPNQSKI